MNFRFLKSKKNLLLLAFWSMAGFLLAQDIHYSMFNRAPINSNPGLVGVFGGDVRVTSNYRQQWGSVPVDYKTFTITFEQKVFPTKMEKGFITLGGHLNYDDAGDLSLQQVTPGFVASYVRPIGESNRHFLSFGGQLGFTSRSYNSRNIRVDAQFNGDVFDPSLPTLEENILDDSRSFASFGGGLNYRFQNPNDGKRKRVRLDLGLGIYHLLRSNKSFHVNEESNLDRRISLYGTTAFEVKDDLDLGLVISNQFQGPHNELVYGANVRIYFIDNKEKKDNEEKKGKKIKPTALLLGLAYRAGDSDALIPQINLDFNHFSFGFSWDWNLSEFDIATNGNGGPELSGIYTFGKPRVKRERKCKIF